MLFSVQLIDRGVRTARGKYIFAPNMIDLWSLLPQDVVMVTGLDGININITTSRKSRHSENGRGNLQHAVHLKIDGKTIMCKNL